MPKRTLFTSLAVTWAGLIFLGAWAMTRYESTPGPARPAPAVWPRETSLVLKRDAATMLVFLHPRCSCSEATLTELERLLIWGHGRVRALAIFVMPEKPGEAWTDSSILRHASAIPNLEIIRDPGGLEAHHFGALTSGFTEVFASSGALQFAGGITPARGQTGDSKGAQAIRDAISQGTRAGRKSRVFGCLLENPAPPGS